MIANRILPSCRFEHLPLAVFESSAEASRAVAREMGDMIRSAALENRSVVLGLATGSTPLGLYSELVRLHREEGLSFSNIVAFNLDEYCGLPAGHAQSYRHFMRVHLFDHIDVTPGNINIPDGMLTGSALDAHCREYEARIRAAGGIDLQILGIGRTGHIGFNEPGSARRSRTRQVTLDPLTRRDAAHDFGGEEQTPRYGVTMGVRTILEARRVVLLAWGQHKAAIVRQALEGPVTSQITASFLQEHDDAQVILDSAAADGLTRFHSPWLLGPLEDQGLTWDERMTRRAILWLSRGKQKAILKLTDEDYNEFGLQDLLKVHGSAYAANLNGFYQTQHTITGWPGGRDPARTHAGDAPVRPLRARSAEIFPKRILLLSPHPGDDVVAMGGTMCRLVEHRHEVHVAYQVSGANSVSDHALWRALLFPGETENPGRTGLAQAEELKRQFVATGSFHPGHEVTRLKGMLRRSEAVAAARICGVPQTRLSFLELPFYHRAIGRFRQIGAEDIATVVSLLDRIEPHLIYVAGDLDDPNGTHRLCLRALREAMLLREDSAWQEGAEIWFYRGAWAEWDADEIDLAVPLSPQEVLRRRRAIFCHASLRDPFHSLDGASDEAWHRIEARGRRLADTYNALGLAEYESIESFKRYSPRDFVRFVPV